MNVTLQFSDSQYNEIQEAAKRLGVPPEEMAREAVLRFVAYSVRDFESAADYVLNKNAELYRRLS